MSADRNPSTDRARAIRLVGFGMAAAVVIGYVLLVQAFQRWVGVGSEGFIPGLFDLTIYRAGGSAIVQGTALYGDVMFRDPGGQLLPWTYPPFGAVVMVPFALVPVGVAQALWWTATLAALVGIVVVSFRDLLARSGRRRLTVALLVIAAIPITPIAECFGLGQVGVILTLACLLDAVTLTRRRSRWTGVLVGVAAAVKLTPAMFIGYWLLTRQWRAAVTALATMAACWAFAAAIAWQNTVDYVVQRRMLGVNEAIGDWTTTRFNQSWHGVVDRYGDGNAAVWLALVVMTLAATGVLAVLAYRRGNLLAAATTVGLATVLVSPVSWHHHAVWVLPAIAVVLGAGTSLLRVVGAAGLTIVSYYPARGYQLPGSDEMWIVLYLILLCLLAVAVRRPADTSRHARL